MKIMHTINDDIKKPIGKSEKKTTERCKVWSHKSNRFEKKSWQHGQNPSVIDYNVKGVNWGQGGRVVWGIALVIHFSNFIHPQDKIYFSAPVHVTLRHSFFLVFLKVKFSKSK